MSAGGKWYRAGSGSSLSHRQSDCEILYDELQGSTYHRKIDSASHPAAALLGADSVGDRIQSCTRGIRAVDHDALSQRSDRTGQSKIPPGYGGHGLATITKIPVYP